MATTALQKITTKAKQIRKAMPNMKWTDAIKKASKELKGSFVSGVKKKTVKKTAVKRATPKTKKIAVTVGRISSAKKMNDFSKGMSIIKNIDKLENQRKNANGKHAKDFIQHIINAEHKKLNSIQAQLKRK